MKINYVSDIHLEFSPNFTINDTGDILVLCGDIIPANLLNESFAKKFFNDISSRFNQVLYILGNHEFYQYDLTYVNKIKNYFTNNITVLHNESIVIDNIKFIGGTCWSDFHKVDAMTMKKAPRMISDFKSVKNNGSILTVYDWLEEHSKFINVLKQELTNEYTNIVCTHHAPSYLTINDRFKDRYESNGCYSSDLTRFMDNVDYWFYGHMHEGYDVDYNNCKILTNPRSYPNEPRFHNYIDKYVLLGD